MPLAISSPDFENGKSIPKEFTCEGSDKAPTLIWEGAPEKTKSLVLIMDDPDAPNGMWVHWVLFNIPPTIKHLNANNNTPAGAISGTNSWGNIGYGGPCPPTGQHRYFFKIYALDSTLNLTAKATKKDVEAAMQTHIIDKAEVSGIYKKQGK